MKYKEDVLCYKLYSHMTGNLMYVYTFDEKVDLDFVKYFSLAVGYWAKEELENKNADINTLHKILQKELKIFENYPNSKEMIREYLLSKKIHTELKAKVYAKVNYLTEVIQKYNYIYETLFEIKNEQSSTRKEFEKVCIAFVRFLTIENFDDSLRANGYRIYKSDLTE